MNFLSSQNEMELNHLKKILQEKAKIKVISSSDCLKLKNKLEAESSIQISFSSYRRLFGLIKSSTLFSKYTLDIFSELCGYENWDDFYLNFYNQKTETKNQLLINHFINNQGYQLNLPIKLTTWDDANRLYTVLLQSIYIEDYQLMITIFDNLYKPKNSEIFDDLISFITQPICIACHRGDEKLISFINDNLANSNLIDFVIRASVFEDKLNDYYGNWIAEVSKLEKYKDDLFISLMLLQLNFINGKRDNAENIFQNIQKLHISTLSEHHPILAARIAAWEIILLNRVNPIFNSILQNYSTPRKMTFLIFFSRLVWEYSDANNDCELFEWFYTIPEMIDKTFTDQGRKACFLTHFCYIELINKRKIPKVVFDQINTQLFYPSDYNFYCRLFSEIQHNLIENSFNDN